MTARWGRVIALVSAVTFLAAADWPVFRGNPQQTGVTDEKMPDTLVELWKAKTGDSVEGTAAIANGVVYVGSYDGLLYALDLKDGTEKWKFKSGPKPGPFKNPVGVHKGKIYVGDLDGNFFCLSAEGKEQWRFSTDNEITSGAGFAAMVQGDLTADCILFGCGDESMYCLDSAGKKVWQFKVPGGPVMATPLVADGRTMVSGCDSKMHIVDFKTGKELAAIDLEGQTGATPAIKGDVIYVGTMSNQVVAIDVKKKEIAWTFESEKRKQPFFASAAVTDKLVVAGSRDKHVYAIDRASGKEVWHFATEGRIEGSPVIAGNRVYVGSTDDHLYVIDLAKGTEVQRIKLDSSIMGSPAIADGRIVIGTTKGTVYCFGAK